MEHLCSALKKGQKCKICGPNPIPHLPRTEKNKDPKVEDAVQKVEDILHKHHGLFGKLKDA